MDRFQELSKIALDELSEVFARMSDENVRELLRKSKMQSVFFCLVQEGKGFPRESLLCA